MAQNIYDQPDFFAGYSSLNRSLSGLNGAPEWPAMQAMLPSELSGARVVDLGCGFGWFSRWVVDAGAASVVAYDVSRNMLERAIGETASTAIAYMQIDLDKLTLPEASFDMAFSSLTLHYLTDLPRLFEEVHRALVPGGTFVVSVEHPMMTAPLTQGWITDPYGRRSWPVNNYLVNGKRTTDWLAPGVEKQHRSITTYLRTLLDAGFVLTHFEEWGPTDVELAESPLLAAERDRPTFLLLAVQRT
jgi:ubiquinone/menaquinone biosynthesis C-methylase UbiE